MDMGKGFWWKTVGAIIGLGILGLLAFLVFNGLVYRFGALGGLIVVFGILMAIAYRSDRKRQHEYED